MNWKYIHTKVRGGALQYTLFIAVIIALLIFAFINLTAVQQKLKLKSQFYIQTIEVTHDQFANLSKPYQKESTNLESSIQTESKVKPWGLYSVQTIQNQRNNEVFSKSAIIASHQNQRPALFLKDNNQPLVIVGTAKIQGEAWLPKKGIKAGSIGGKSYYGKQLVYGNKRTSNATFPPIAPMTQYQDINEMIVNAEADQIKSLPMNAQQVHSFDAPTLIYLGGSHVLLKDVNLTGNIIIQADRKITVYASAILQDLILLAPEIEVLSGVKGNFQAFATENIKVGEKCELQYPSGLVLDRNGSIKSKENEVHQIQIKDEATVKGIVGYFDKQNVTDRASHILIDPKAQIFGEVFSAQNVELKGRVYGSVYCGGFIAHEFGSTYINHIYNGQILSNELVNTYAGLAFEHSEPTVAKWIYY